MACGGCRWLPGYLAMMTLERSATSMTEPRSAGVRHEVRLLGKSTSEVVKATKAAREIASTYRVYVYEPVLISRHVTELEAQEVFAKKYEGRVKDFDITPPDNISTKYTLYVTLWNVSAEFKHLDDADEWRQGLLDKGHKPEDVLVVSRNSRAEVVLQQYGVLKLPG